MKTYPILFLIIIGLIFNSCVNKEEKLRLLSKKWTYSEETLQTKLNQIEALKKSGNPIEKASALMLEQVFPNLGNMTIEFDSRGNFIGGFSNNNNLLFSSKSTANWNVDDKFSIITIRFNDNTEENYKIEELTETSLRLSYFKDGVEVVESYVPFKESLKIEQQKPKKEPTSLEINIEPFSFKNDILFGYVVKQDSTDSKCIFYSREEGDFSDTKMKINGRVVKFNFINEQTIDEKSFTREYQSDKYSLKIDFMRTEETDYRISFIVTIHVSNNFKEEVIENLYGQEYSD